MTRLTYIPLRKEEDVGKETTDILKKHEPVTKESWFDH